MWSHSSNHPRTTDVDVVIIDDDPVLLVVVNALLQDQHIRTEACPLGWEAHRCIRMRQPRLVILDIEMPDVDGIQLFYLLRADPQTSDIPVLFLTINPLRVHEELPNYEEMSAVLISKPFDVESLLGVVRAALAA